MLQNTTLNKAYTLRYFDEIRQQVEQLESHQNKHNNNHRRRFRYES